MMKSILFRLLATTIVISGPMANAQQPAKLPRIGFLDTGTASGSASFLEVPAGASQAWMD